MAVVVPPYLQPGDTIGIVCPSGFMPAEKMESCIQTLETWGYRVIKGFTAGNQHHYFSGTDAERLQDLQQMLDHPSVHAILCGRGGYGLSRIIDQLDFSRFLQQPKWIIGFSDITLLHAHLQAQHNIVSIHAPMAAAFNNGPNEYLLSLKNAVQGQPLHYTAPSHPFNRTGFAEALITGGNLALLAHITGTPSAVNMQGKILFIEDVGEYTYSVDRMMQQLKRSGQLADLAALIVGSFSDMKDTVIPFGQSVYEVIRDAVSEYTYPVCFDFPVGHVTENYAIKTGMNARITIGETVTFDQC
jgi:muramoyltetrapeptide carboxypeptidase